MSDLCFRITPAAPTAIVSRLPILDHTLTAWWGRAKQARMVCTLRPASFAEQIASVPDATDWRRAHTQERRRMYVHLQDQVLEVDTTLALWGAGSDAGLIERTLPDAWGVPGVALTAFPQIVHGPYTPRATYLEPQRRGDPYLAVLTATSVQGLWSPIQLDAPGIGIAEGWHELLLLDNIRLSLAIDIQTYDPFVAQGKIRTILHNALSPLQRRSAEAIRDALRSESLHLVRYALLLQGRTRDDLDLDTQRVKQVLGRRLPMERVAGAQDLHVRFFQNRAPSTIRTPVPAHNTTSRGLAAKTPQAVRRAVVPHGVLLGTDIAERVPVHYELFGVNGRENGNAVVCGTAGSGKTTFLLDLALRHALAGYQVFLMEPAFHGWKLRDAINDPRACAYHEVADSPAINVLDVHASTPLDQLETVIRKLETALGQPKHEYGRITVQADDLSDDERGALDQALMSEGMYGAKGHKLATLTTDTTPTLSTLVEILADYPMAARLVARIRARLLGSAAALYDRRTTLRFDRTKPVTIFSFKGVKKERLPLLYAHLFDAITDHVWSSDRDKPSQPVMLIIDEYYFMKAVPLMEEEVIKATKTGRARRFCVITADQNVSTYYGKDSNAGALITGNARQKFFFQLKEETDVLATAYGAELGVAHLDQIRRLDTGQCVAMLGTDVRTLDIELTPLERRALLQ